MTIRQRISDAEWQARLDLAACYRLVARYGMADLIYNHITVRVPGEAGHILINPFGYLYEEITAFVQNALARATAPPESVQRDNPAHIR